MVNVGLNHLPINPERKDSISYLMQFFLLANRSVFPLDTPAGWVDGQRSVTVAVGWVLPPETVERLKLEFGETPTHLFGLSLLEQPATVTNGFLFIMISGKGADGIALRPDLSMCMVHKTDGIYTAVLEKESIDESNPE